MKYDYLKHIAAYTYNGTRYHGFRTNFEEISTDHDGLVTRMVGLLCGDLTVTVTVTDYEGYDASCVSVVFENKTDHPSARLADVDSLDMAYFGHALTLRGIYGDGGADERGAYAPYAIPLYGESAEPVTMEPPTGRGTYNYFPYFHLHTDKRGLFIALGHPIIWRGEFVPTSVVDESGASIPAVNIKLGQAHFDSVLLPGESVTLPSVTLLYHTCPDVDDAMNHWRHFLMDCIMRRPNGALFPPHMSGGTSWLYAEMRDATEKNQIDAMNAYLDHGVPIDYWWMDAGWYFRREGEQLSTWMDTGTWLPDTSRFPTAFAAISEHGAANGVKTLLWFEPEMARLPDADLGPRAMSPQYRLLASPLMDMGNPDFVEWCFERFSSILDAGKISLYRQDYGVNPADVFLHPGINPEGRVGMVENRYARGYYALWDKLIARYPDMMIDSCAAGGGRNDIDSMRRAVPLHKTDHDYSRQDDKQSMHQSLFAWLPYFGACLVGPDKCAKVDAYMMQSTFAPWVALASNVYSDTLDWDCLCRYGNLWRELSDLYYADYYPLTPWSHGDTDWRGWEFYDPASGRGFVQLFRPKHAAETAYTVKLRGLDPTATYELRNRETDERITATGASLLRDGTGIRLDTPESAVVICICRL